MEGRIDRDSLRNSDTQRARPYERRASYGLAGSPRRPGRRGVEMRKKGFPQGRQLFFSQLIASGLLVLAVLVISLVKVHPATEARTRLQDALSHSITYSDAVSGADELIGAIRSVVDTQAYGRLSPAEEEGTQTEGGGIIIDPDILEEINQMEDISKN